MFARTLQMKIVKDQPVVEPPTRTVYVVDPSKATKIAMLAGALYAGKTLVDTTSKIALHLATK